MDQQLNVKRLHLKYLRGLEVRQEAELRNTEVSFKTLATKGNKKTSVLVSPVEGLLHAKRCCMLGAQE